MENNQVIINDSASVAYLKGPQVMFSISRGASSQPTSPDSPIVSTNSLKFSGDLAKWGVDNLFPQNTMRVLKKNTIIKSTLDWKARTLYSGGLGYGKITFDGDGNEKRIPMRVPQIEDFIRKSNIKRYLAEFFKDYVYWSITFPEFIVSNDRKSIAALSIQDAMFCRWKKQNQDTGKIEQCYINANWELHEGITSKLTTTVPVLDPYYDPVSELKSRTDSFKYIYPISYHSNGNVYYPEPDWYTAIESGWVDVAHEIVTFKRQLLKNQLTIKYHVQIPSYYWSHKYPKWDTTPEKKRKEIIEEETKRFNDFLQGSENAGKSIITIFKYDERSQKEFPGWRITAIDDKIKDGAYIEDSQEASSHILYALGVDATLIGTTPGKGLGAGSGSDKRVAYNITTSTNVIHQEYALEPLYFVRDYNGWDPEIDFWIKNSLITTLDTGKQTQQTNNQGK
jgi:hypothetical protein